MNTKTHYENHLSKYYSWIFGGTEENIEKNKTFFQSHNIMPAGSKAAIDLGAGSGFQSTALSQIGFNVTAVDFSRQLLDEIENKDGSIEIIEGDILNFDSYSSKNPELIICMGDTLPHLPDIDSVEKLIKNAFNELASKGKIVLTFRDLTFELKGTDRFIPVRSDADKVFTCFLEYHNDYLDVYDIVNENENGRWIQKISSYKKIKISEEQIKSILNTAGFKIDYFNKDKGLITIIGNKE